MRFKGKQRRSTVFSVYDEIDRERTKHEDRSNQSVRTPVFQR